MEKEIFTLKEVAEYTGYSKSHLYKLTHFNKITHYKPNGKTIFFRKKDIDTFLLKNRVEAKPFVDLEEEAANYLLTSKI